MRIILFLISLLVTVGVIYALDSKLLFPAALGPLLSPQHGVWQNAEPVDADFNATLQFPELSGKTEVYFDERLVPHVFAEADNDAYFVQGYLHAKFRLWQMEFQTHVASGRLSEILGDKTATADVLNVVDRYFRRLGLTYAAEKSMKLLNEDPVTRSMCDAYTAGVNAYIKTLTASSLPLEYKLLGYRPEPWTNLKMAVFSKYIAYELSASENDLEYTNARNAFTRAVYNKMYPVSNSLQDPIVPGDAVYQPPSVIPVVPPDADSLYFRFKAHDTTAPLPVLPQKPDSDNGSNNWAVNGTKTKSGYPILCNDPHQGLNLPSLWFEIQLNTPTLNVYGASFLCSPGVAIGFNDSCAFGFTSAGRDVKDYYEIEFRDASRKQYRFDGQWKDTEFRIERIRVKGKPDFVDSVAYTVFGPVMFDNSYKSKNNDGKYYAVRWKAHDASNELVLFYKLNRAKNYLDYVRAIRNLQTPGQNVVYAAKNGDIAIRAQGVFPAKWKRQGDFVMPGKDSAYMWQGVIPQPENPYQFNPLRGFVSSANQVPADTSYPYYLSGSFSPFRGMIINRKLAQMQQITPNDMKELQTDNYNILAEMVRPVLLNALDEKKLPGEAKNYYELLKAWNLRNDKNEKGATVFSVLFDSLRAVIYRDELGSVKNYILPYESTLVESLLRDSVMPFLDDINTPAKETLEDDLVLAFKKALPVLQSAEKEGRLEWARFKDTRIQHLARLQGLSRMHLDIGGGTNIINATKATHGPSWRMIVHLTPETEAYGVYPGGQSGHPGSRYYDNFVDTWVQGKYYPLQVMKKGEGAGKARWTMSFRKRS